MYIYVHIYTYMYTLKTLRVTAVSTGDGVIIEKGGNQGIGRNHQDPTGNARFTRSKSLKARPGHFLGVLRDVWNTRVRVNGL